MHGNIPGSGVVFWTEDRVAELRRLAAQGLSGLHIATAVGATRSATISKLYREGIWTKCSRPQQATKSAGPRRRPPHGWQPEEDERLRELAGQGVIFTRIGAILGRTRKAVSARAKLIGVRNLSKTVKARRERERKIALTATSTWGRRAVIARAIALGELEPCEATDLPPEPNRPVISLQNLHSHHCRWPIGDPGSSDFGFCGESIRDDSVPYCTHHCRIAYVPISKRALAQLEAQANA